MHACVHIDILGVKMLTTNYNINQQNVNKVGSQAPRPLSSEVPWILGSKDSKLLGFL